MVQLCGFRLLLALFFCFCFNALNVKLIDTLFIAMKLVFISVDVYIPRHTNLMMNKT